MTGLCLLIQQLNVLISTLRISLATQQAVSNYKNRLTKPSDHGFGRSRGGLSTKTHALVDGAGLPIVVSLTPGQAGDNPMALPLLDAIRVPRKRGRPRTRPDELRADKAYSSRQVREFCRAHHIKVTIPEPVDRIRNRKRQGSRGGRPPAFDKESYKGRNVVERRFCDFKQWRGLATRYDKYAIIFRAGILLASMVAWLKKIIRHALTHITIITTPLQNTRSEHMTAVRSRPGSGS